MFKKTIFLLFSLFLLYIGSFIVFAKEDANIIYLEKGNSSYDFEIDGATLISGDVDTNTLGSYVVTYIDNYTKSYFDINYIVVDCLTNKNVDSFQESLSLVKEENYQVSNLIKKDNITICSLFKYNPGKLNSLFDKQTVINIYNGNILKSMMTIGGYNDCVKLVFSKVGFIALYNYDQNGKTHFRMIEYSLSGAYLRELNVSSNAYDIARNIIIDEEYIYIIFNSSSSNSPFISKISGISTAMIAKINYLKFSVEDYISFGNNTSNEIIDSFSYNDYLYIIFKPFGSGEFYKKLSASKFIVKFNKDLEQINYIEVGNDDAYYGASISKDLISFLVSPVYPSNKIIINKYDLDLKLIETDELFIDNDDYSLSKIVKSIGFGIVAILGKSKEDNSISLLGLIDLDKNEYTYYFEQDLKITNLEIIDNNIYLAGSNQNNIKVYDYYHLEQVNNDLYLNKKLSSSLLVSDTYLDNRLYGLNKKVIKIIMGKASFFKELDYYLALESSIKQGETYELGTIVFANGIKYLGDKLIEDGYILDKEGDQLLKIYGTNNEVHYIEFNVQKIINEAATNLTSIDVTRPNISVSVDNYKSEIAQVEVSSVVNEEDQDSLPDMVMGTIIAGVLVAGGFIIPIKPKRGRK
ncbi:MAG: hypothetical protein J5691_05075 [Bacilli bacterium]|nr:hypothetical protein [Bacilli bacterium]